MCRPAKASASAEVWLCPITGKAQVKIGRGENGGHTLTYSNVVRRWVKLGDWNGKAQTFSVPVADLADADFHCRRRSRRRGGAERRRRQARPDPRRRRPPACTNIPTPDMRRNLAREFVRPAMTVTRRKKIGPAINRPEGLGD